MKEQREIILYTMQWKNAMQYNETTKCTVCEPVSALLASKQVSSILNVMRCINLE